MTETEAKKKVLDLARSEIGYHETGDNQTKYASAYDFDTKLYGFDMSGYPWCDFFTDWLFMKSFGFDLGSAMTYQFSGCSGAACASSAGYYKNNHAWYTSPEVGDQIFFYVSGGINHTGIVEMVDDNYITTIEGNSSDQVKRNSYRIGNTTIAGYGRPLWKAVASIESKAENAAAEETATTEEETTTTATTDKVCKNKLSFGSIGDIVKVLQSVLNYYGGTLDVDGEFGVLTKAELLRYQSTHADEDGNQLDADGICGEKTWRSF